MSGLVAHVEPLAESRETTEDQQAARRLLAEAPEGAVVIPEGTKAIGEAVRTVSGQGAVRSATAAGG